ncbi:hypothetical protein F5X96DRAFT_101311 [Biscogniauxia mediterranea]|nr:hypothetical protein F5X96DRAFT_101311 [Biscogniauxia mediterranea]
MTDNTCGPSNAFKGLARHVDQDRTHQQDRVVAGPHHAGQAFRTAPSNPAAANSHFAAFQGGNAPLPGFGVPDMRPQPAFAPPPSSYTPIQPLGHAQNGYGDWVNEFQRNLHLGETVSPSLHHPSAPQNPAMGLGHRPTMGANYYPAPSMHQHMPPTMMGPAGVMSQQNGYLHGSIPSGTFNAQPQPQHAAVDMIDPLIQQQLDDEFTAAMDNWMRENGNSETTTIEASVGVVDGAPAAQSTHSDSHVSHSGIDTNAQLALAMHHAQTMQQSENVETRPLGTEEAMLAYQSQPEQEASDQSRPAETQPLVDTELARAAQQLVDSVSDNDSEKFRNSSFLQMMRRIAAEEVTVRGNELVETPRAGSTEIGSGSHVTGRTSAATSSTRASGQTAEAPGNQNTTPPTG